MLLLGRKSDADARTFILQRHYDLEQFARSRGSGLVREDFFRTDLLDTQKSIPPIRISQLSCASRQYFITQVHTMKACRLRLLVFPGG
jgi:hypothetical protein